MKNIHGKPSTFSLKPNTIPKPLMEHKTLFHIKVRTNISGNKILEIATILNGSGMKVEANFENALREKNHVLEDFFEVETIDMEIYGQPDFQMWQFNEEGNLVDKMGNLPFKNIVFNLPKVGEACQIENASSGQVLCIKNGTYQVVFKKKRIKKKFQTRSAKSKQQQISDDVWILYPADSSGFFRIKHAKSGKFLSSFVPGKVTIEHQMKAKDTKGKKVKKVLVKVKKTFVSVPDIEAFISFIAKEREYEDEELQTELGIDGGQGFLKIMLSVQRLKDCQPDPSV